MYDGLLKTARNDLKSAGILYKEELYPQALSHFQQSVEKSNKAFGLISRRVTEDMLQRHIGHKPLRIHLDIIKEQKKVFENCEKMMQQRLLLEGPSIKRSEVKKCIKEMKKFLRDTKSNQNNPIKHSKISKQELQGMIDFFEKNCENISNTKPKSFDFKEEDSESMKLDILGMFSNLKNKYPEQYQQIKEVVDALNVENMKEIIIFMYESFIILIPAYMSTLFLSYIVNPLFPLLRYPQENFSPEEFYNSKLPLVELLPKLMDMQDKSIRGIEKFDKFLEEKNKNSKIQ